jgi:hypothetical protein
MPPPSITPPRPTDASSPVGNPNGVFARASTNSPWFRPVPTVAVFACGLIVIVFNGLTSMTMPPSTEDQPSSECRPLRARNAMSLCRAYCTACTTSSAVWQNTTACG